MKNKLFLLLAVFLSGCTSSIPWRYEPAVSTEKGVETPYVLLVPDFIDERPQTMAVSTGSFLISRTSYLVERELIGREVKPLENMAEATAQELETSRLFKKVFYTNDPVFYQNPIQSQLILEGTLSRAQLETEDGYTNSGILGVFFVLGIPYAKTTQTLEIIYRLKQPDGTILFEKLYSANISKYHGFYYNPFMKLTFEPLLKDILLHLKSDLAEKLSENSENRSEI